MEMFRAHVRMHPILLRAIKSDIIFLARLEVVQVGSCTLFDKIVYFYNRKNLLKAKLKL